MDVVPPTTNENETHVTIPVTEDTSHVIETPPLAQTEQCPDQPELGPRRSHRLRKCRFTQLEIESSMGESLAELKKRSPISKGIFILLLSSLKSTNFYSDLLLMNLFNRH